MSSPGGALGATHTIHTVTCPNCGETVPSGVFCGACGVHLLHHETTGRAGNRAHAYAAAPGEHVLRLTIVSSLFPHLPHRSRAPFRIGTLVLFASLFVLAALRLQTPMIAVAAIGVPVLFMLYLYESDVYEDVPNSLLATVAAIGIVLGVLWPLLTADYVREQVRANVLGAVDIGAALIAGVLIPLGTVVLMLAPVAVARFMRPPHLAESMDGFLLGSMGALGFTAADTVYRLAPQLKTGVIAATEPVHGVVVEALLQGVAVPLTAAGAGGVVGATLWVRRRTAVHGLRQFTSPVVAVAAMAVLYVLLGLVDFWQPEQDLLVVLHLVAAAAALLVLRAGVHAVLLHEEHDVAIGPPRVCPHCEQVVPAMPFCPHCGFASRSAARATRARLHLPEPAATTAEEAP